MRNRRLLLILLAGVNVALFALLSFSLVSLPRAFGQVGGRQGDFISVTAKASGQNYDVYYLLDVPARKLHAFYPTNVQAKQYARAPFRDLRVDFGERK